jgi:cell division protein FtsB
MHLQKQVTVAEQTLEETRTVRTDQERRISLLRSEQLDADMLDERARIMAGLVRPDELIVIDTLTSDNR